MTAALDPWRYAEAMWAAPAEQLWDLPEPRRAWAPLPHQVPPAGQWYLWLMMAGRGAGKTDGCARYLDAHVNGPPCLPDFAGGHRPAIIAPTLGDALDACVNGPSGIKAHNPAVRSAQTTGGTYVRWPNGTEAKLFGAHTPEDVERLRAGGNRCVAKGSMIETAEGPRPIETLRRGDLVWTRTGLRPVLEARRTGRKRLHLVSTSDRWLLCTDDHPFATPDGFRDASSLVNGGKVLVWQKEQSEPSSSTTGSAGGSARMGTSATAGVDSSTATSTSGRSDPSPPATTCTTATTTGPTTDQRTSKPSRPASTCASTPVGTSPGGTPPGAGLLVSALSAPSSASAAAPSSPAGQRSPLGTAALSAASEALRHEHSSSACAACVVEGSPPQSEGRPGRAVPTAVRSLPTALVADTYDLLVEGHHEFIANGIVVGNCCVWLEELAAWRYLEAAWTQMRLGLRLGPRPHAVASTTPKPRPLIQAIEGRLPAARTAELLGDAKVVITRASTQDNPHLAPAVRDALFSTYGGTRLGRQELYAELLEESEGALWRRSWIVREPPPRWGIIARTVVALDPAGGTEAGDEQAIVVACLGLDGRYYVVHSEGVRMSPDAWLRRAALIFEHFRADKLIYEKNYGDKFLTALLSTVVPHLPATAVDATVGKRTRAEPISALYEQAKVVHVGDHDVLEDQLVTYTGAPGERSPDRLDALVWALTELSRGANWSLGPRPMDGRPTGGLTDDLLGPRAVGF